MKISSLSNTVTNSHIALQGATTYVPISIYATATADKPDKTYTVLINKSAIDNILDYLTVERRAPDEDNTIGSDRVFESHVYNDTATANVYIKAIDPMASIEMVRLNNTSAQDQQWRSMSSGALNAGVTQLKEGKNEFMFIIRPANTSIYGAYYLNINYTAVDMSLDRLEVRPDAMTEEPIEFKGKDFKPNVFDYEINIDNSKDQYIFVADAQEALKSVKEKKALVKHLRFISVVITMTYMIYRLRVLLLLRAEKTL